MPQQPDDNFIAPQPTSGYDELLDGSGDINAPWRYLMDAMTTMGHAELSARQDKAHALLRGDGATYRAYNTTPQQPVNNSWRMDLLPWLIESEQWQEIEAGLLERAELLNHVLKDLYGERELIHRGIVPPEVVFGHPGFLRACQDITLPGDHQLIMHAVDLARRSDGTMCVLSDRAQAPSGAGYALENRIVMTRILPSVFRDSHVHRLSGFFQALRAKLLSLAPGPRSPTIAILTPGALNETYFEHAYLANYLGFELVQSADLSVRDNALWMKTVNGWSQVHVLLRRVDDIWCDPVELRGDSQLGVPGLLEVVRAGNVVIANPMGSGILESPALLAYLPDIARHFMGRDLKLPTVNSWWCGDTDSFEYVVDHLDQLVIKPVFRGPGMSNILPADLDEDARTALLRDLVSKPHRYVAQERVAPSLLPALGHKGFVPRPAILRTFSVASDNAYRLMPGGLTRVGHREDAAMISNQTGSISKDTWIVASELQKRGDDLSGEVSQHPGVARASELPKRVVENMFWFGRYAERAEFGLRMTRTLLLQSADIGSDNEAAQLALLRAVIHASDSAGALQDTGIEPTLANAGQILGIALAPRRSASLVGSVDAMLICAEETKELMTFDTQRVINQIRDEARALADTLEHTMFSAPEDALNPTLTSLLALSGILHENVNRGTGWSFLDVGRRLERGIQSARELRYLLGEAHPPMEQAFALESLLVSTENLVFYRRLYQGRLELRSVLELVLLDEQNPRGLLFQLLRLGKRLKQLPDRQGVTAELNEAARPLLEAQTLLQLTRLDTLCSADEIGERQALQTCCLTIEELLERIAIALSETYFDQAIAPQQLLRPHRGAVS